MDDTGENVIVVIYGLRDPRTPDELSIRYVGYTTTSLKKRLGEHISDKVLCHRVNWIQSLLRQGIKPDIYVIEECGIEILKEREKFWIRHYRELGCDLTNATDGGDGTPNPSQETREKLARASRGRIVSQETREKLRIASTGRPSVNKGVPMAEAIKKKIGDAQRGSKNHRFGKKNTPDHIQKVIAAHLGVPRPPDVRAKLSASKTGEKNPMYGKPVSQEHRDKISAANRGKSHPNSPQARKKIGDAHRGKKHTPEHNAKIRMSLLGKIISEEQRILISIANKGKKRTPEQIARSVNAKKEARRLKQLAGMENTAANLFG